MKHRALLAIPLGVALFVGLELVPLAIAPAKTRTSVVEAAEARVYVDVPLTPDEPSAEVPIERPPPAPVGRKGAAVHASAAPSDDAPPPWPTPVTSYPSAWR